MKKKKYLYISIGFVAALAIVLVMGMRQNVDSAQIQEMEQLCSEVLPYISLGEKSSVAAQASQFSYQGIVASSSELNSGLAKFSNGTFDYYVDSAFDQLRKVESMSDFNLDATPLAEDEILAASDQLFITASGEDIFSGCVKNVSQASDELSYSIDYTYMKGDVGVPAASITYLYDGTLFYAYFYNMDVLDNPELQSLGDPALSAGKKPSKLPKKPQKNSLLEKSVKTLKTICWMRIPLHTKNGIAEEKIVIPGALPYLTGNRTMIFPSISR
ncbi:MAG: hypothetical protein V8S32_02575 [Lachnospiraceae bacterium]